jgi:hypothetical protein
MGYPDIEAAKRMALEFCQLPRTGRFITHNKAGAMRGRSLTANLRTDFTVEVLTPREFARSEQVKRDPRSMLIWDDAPVESWTAPTKVVFASGTTDVLEGNAVKEWFEARKQDYPRIQHRTPEYAAQNWNVLIFAAEWIRMEGFAADNESLVYDDVARGLQFTIDR